MKELDPLWLEWPHTRVRRRLETDAGVVRKFVVQLEYNPGADSVERAPDDWLVVARFDHDTTPGGGHDVSEEGLHLDIYRDGERFRRSRDFPSVPLSKAMSYCEEFFENNGDRLVARFKQWEAFN